VELWLICQLFADLLAWIVLRNGSDTAKEIEILVLHHQHAVLRRDGRTRPVAERLAPAGMRPVRQRCTRSGKIDPQGDLPGVLWRHLGESNPRPVSPCHVSRLRPPNRNDPWEVCARPHIVIE